MSFRSAWRHAAKTSPSSSPYIAPYKSGTTTTTTTSVNGGQSEPTLVVTNSRPSSTHDLKTDQPVKPLIQDNTKQPDETVPPIEPAKPSDDVSTDSKVPGPEIKATESQDGGWFAWWGAAKAESTTTAKPTESKQATEPQRPSSAPEPLISTETITAKPTTTSADDPPPPSEQTSPPSEPVTITPPPKASDETSTGSYLAWLWSSRSPPKPTVAEPEKANSEAATTNDETSKPPKATEPVEPPKPAPAIEVSIGPKAPESRSRTPAPDQAPISKPPESTSATPNPLLTTLPHTRSSWMSFWARSDSMPDLKRTIQTPETMQVPDDIDAQGRPIKRQKTQDDSTLDIPTTEVNALIKPTIIKPSHTPSNSTSAIPVGTPSKPPASPKPETPSKTPKKDPKVKLPPLPPPPNHVLPDFETVYPSVPAKEGLLSRVTRAIIPTAGRAPYYILPGALHAHPRRSHPPPIRKAVAIGIHGFFPLRILRSVLGEPTGTSVKFATLASEAIHRFSARTYGSASAVEVVKIALEGEGTVAARIDMLWKSLVGKEEWMTHIREADLILVACHSQGSPVGAGIMARLVEEGCVGEGKRLGLLCVAGIHLGPAIDVGQRVVIKAYNAIESEAARELYDFQDSDSKVSRKYVEALRTILAHDTRVTLIGSIDDHLVPMHSSTFSTAYHGAIFRAVFIDGRIHTNDFLARLVAFALRLRNEGWRDHGVMSELSSALMGNFYTGEGHSRIYAEPAVYDLALRNTLETTSMRNMPLHVEKFKARTTPNPYLLPWSMRGVLEETIRGPLSHELDELKEEFARWDPKGPKLKDLKWRMEGWSMAAKPKI